VERTWGERKRRKRREKRVGGEKERESFHFLLTKELDKVVALFFGRRPWLVGKSRQEDGVLGVAVDDLVRLLRLKRVVPFREESGDLRLGGVGALAGL